MGRVPSLPPDMANPKDLVREGYDRVSRAYRGDTFDSQADPRYRDSLELLAGRLAVGSRLLDLGCGCGIPATEELSRQHRVTGVDISPVQIERARSLVPRAEFMCADMTTMAFVAGEFDAVVSLYAIIHIPVNEQPDLLGKIRTWLKPGGWLLCTVGHQAWTGTEENWLGVAGAKMFWSHADQGTYEAWLKNAGFRIEAARFMPEGDGGHALLLAQTMVVDPVRPGRRLDRSPIGS